MAREVPNSAAHDTRTANKKIRVLNAMLRWGVRQQIIKANPIEGTKHLPDKPKVPLRALEEKEITALLAHSPDGVADIWELFIHTGLRKRELSTLRPKDVDLKDGVLTVRSDVSKNGKGRQIPLSKRAKEILGNRVKGKNPAHPIIQTIFSPSRRPRDVDFYEGCLKVLQRCCKAAKVDLTGINVHSLRRTFATRMIAKGATPGAVQRLMGHQTMGITMEIYNRVRLGDLKDAVSILDE